MILQAGLWIAVLVRIGSKLDVSAQLAQKNANCKPQIKTDPANA